MHSLRSEHQNYPIKLFSLMDMRDEEAGRAVVEMSECRLDEWSSTLLAPYKARPGGWHRDLRADLWHTAMQHEFDNASREAHHASIR